MELRFRSYEQNKHDMAFMQNTCKPPAHHSKHGCKHDIMQLHVILSKFHVGHYLNRATVQPIQAIQGLRIICPKQQHVTLGAPKQQAKWFYNAKPRHEGVAYLHHNKSFQRTKII
jgi:hypothetical protein